MANEVRILITAKDKSGGAFKSAESRADKFKSFMGGVGRVAGGVLTGNFLTAAGRGIADFFSDSIAEAEEAKRAHASTAQGLKTMGATAWTSVKQIEALSQSISNQIGVDDELIQHSANLLLTFKNVKNEGEGLNAIFDRGVAAAQDLAAKGFGSADSSAKMLGKALNDPIKGITALQRAGVTFTEKQKDTIKKLVETGDVLGAQKIILKEVEDQVGGTAKATATAGDKMKVAWQNALEDFGTKAMPLLVAAEGFITSKLIPAISAMARWMVDHQEDIQEGFIVFAQGFVGAAKIILPGLKVIVTAFLAAVGVILHGAAAAFGWVPGVGDKLKTARDEFDKFQHKVNGVFDSAIDSVNDWDRSLSKTKKKVELKGDIRDLKTKLQQARDELKRPDINRAREIAIKGQIRDLKKKIRDAEKALKNIDGKTADVYIRGHVQGVPSQFGGRAFLAHGGISGAAGGGPRGRLTMTGEYGPELINLAPGSMVHSNPDTERMLAGNGNGGVMHITLQIGERAIGDLIIDPLRKAVRVKGGNVQAVLGS